jgi:putative hydrolase of HD superfamily
MQQSEQNIPESIVHTLAELQRLKRLDRTGWTLRGLPNGTESVAAHSFGVTVAVMLLADVLNERGITLDVERMLRMSLLHDWSETRLGDMPRTAAGYIGSDNRRRAELVAFADIVGSGASSSVYRQLYQEYEERQTLEARLVKAADIIDLLVQVLALERAGAGGLDEFWEAISEDTLQLEGESRAVVDGIFQELLEARIRIRRWSSR